MKFVNSIKSCVLAVVFAAGLIAPRFANAQCPSVMGTGDPAVILLNIYGVPNANIFDFEKDRYGFGLTGGIQIGAIFNPGFQLVSGAELSVVNHEERNDLFLTDTYRTLLLEIPLEMRMRIYDGKKDEAFLTFGLGAVFSNVRETTDPFVTENEMLYHQFFVRLGYEHAIEVKNTFNILWGILAKADPLAIADYSYSFLNGSYYLGLKLGLQFGL